MKSFPLYTIRNRYIRRVIGVPLIPAVCVLALVLWVGLLFCAVVSGATQGLIELFDSYDMRFGLYRFRQIAHNVWYGVRMHTDGETDAS